MEVENPELHKRLRRAQGHLASVVKMVATGRDGMETAHQMQAVIAALQKAKQLILVEHIDSQLAEGGDLTPEQRAKLLGFRDLTRYL
jgi:DNA-binding FrmR family transcriptional regulator